VIVGSSFHHRCHGPRRWIGTLLVVLWGSVLFPVGAGDPKTDVLVLVNGDRFTGQIKSVQQALLTFSTDAAGTVDVEWTYIKSLVSTSEFLVQVSSGERYSGSLAPPDEAGQLKIVGSSETHVVKMSEVVEILPIGGHFWKRLNGSADLGFSYQQSNRAIQYNLAALVQNRTRKGIGTFQVNSLFNTQEDAESSSQSYLSVGATRFRKNRRNVFGLTQVQSNPDQGYNLRWVIGGGAGKFLVERSDMLANVIAGLVYERESITNSDAVDNSAEVLLGIDFGSFKYKQLDRIITMTLNTFTNVTDTPRFRAQLNFKLNWEIVNNFNLGISVLDSYDSRPPTVDAESNDLALTTSVGYSF
jgi:hypothetical protein